MSAVTTYDFGGQTIPVHVVDGAERFTLADLSSPFGISARAVKKLFAENRAECETAARVNLGFTDGRTRATWLLAPLDVYSLAMHLRTEAGAQVRGWIRRTFLAPHLSGARMVTEAQLAAAVDRVREEERAKALPAVRLAEDIAALSARLAALESAAPLPRAPRRRPRYTPITKYDIDHTWIQIIGDGGPPEPGEARMDVRISSTRSDFLELAFSKKPSEAVLQRLRDNRFRWSFTNRVWYGRPVRDEEVAA